MGPHEHTGVPAPPRPATAGIVLAGGRSVRIGRVLAVAEREDVDVVVPLANGFSHPLAANAQD